MAKSNPQIHNSKRIIILLTLFVAIVAPFNLLTRAPASDQREGFQYELPMGWQTIDNYPLSEATDFTDFCGPNKSRANYYLPFATYRAQSNRPAKPNDLIALCPTRQRNHIAEILNAAFTVLVAGAILALVDAKLLKKRGHN
jgi:hypothetical protein